MTIRRWCHLVPASCILVRGVFVELELSVLGIENPNDGWFQEPEDSFALRCRRPFVVRPTAHAPCVAMVIIRREYSNLTNSLFAEDQFLLGYRYFVTCTGIKDTAGSDDLIFQRLSHSPPRSAVRELSYRIFLPLYPLTDSNIFGAVNIVCPWQPDVAEYR
ncbi:hypothetical protein C8Q77DRAFT_478587 [Trametes polyzona]|nr:hypothetical protein C8Q77DRAFT_478587 [Trametes polyzona]